ncbi:hypothetical protein LTR10_004701 [Elasticomyces elasticus]|nr:hypothetical protein LTR10_004701 [Elasticomyces elasticus]
MGYRDAAVDSITIRHHVKVSSVRLSIDALHQAFTASQDRRERHRLDQLPRQGQQPHQAARISADALHHTAFTTPPSPPPKADKSAVDLTTTRHTVTASNPAIDAFSFMLNDTELKFSATQARADESAPVAAPTQRRHMQLKPAALKLFGGLGAEVIGRISATTTVLVAETIRERAVTKKKVEKALSDVEKKGNQVYALYDTQRETLTDMGLDFGDFSG